MSDNAEVVKLWYDPAISNYRAYFKGYELPVNAVWVETSVLGTDIGLAAIRLASVIVNDKPNEENGDHTTVRQH